MNTIETGLKELELSHIALDLGELVMSHLSGLRIGYMEAADEYLERNNGYPSDYELKMNKEYLMKVAACDSLAAHIMKFFK
jgi:predicted component of type VI protein secretion system